MQTVLASSFGLQDVGSTTSPDGAVRALPFAPLPLTHMLPSGLSRAQVRGRWVWDPWLQLRVLTLSCCGAQQLHMLQRFFNVPATPSYQGSAGGLVLDRVVASFGGASWWATATGRLKAQAAWDSPHTREGKPHRALLEPEVYGGAVRARATLPGGLLLRACASLDSLQHWLPRQPSAQSDGQHSAAAPECARAPVRANLSLLSQTWLPRHDVSLDAAWHARCATGGSPRGGAYAEVPRSAVLCVSSRGRGPLRYRLGLITAAEDCGAPAPASAPAAAPSSPLRGFGRVRAQGGCTLGGSLSFFPRAPEKQGNGVRRWPSRARSARADYSAVPQRARLTLGGLVGCVGRAPLRQLAPEQPQVAPPAATPGAPSPGAAHQLRRLAARMGGEGCAFGAVACGLQLGAFSRPLLDYTALSLRCDCAVGSGALSRAMGGGGGGEQGAVTLSASCAQQLLGPVRLRADLRISAAGAARALRRHAQRWGGDAGADAHCAVAAELPEAVYGVDVELPAVLGAARVVGWYCPQRKEAMAELRFLET